MLQETKKSKVHDRFVRSLWPNESMEFMGVDAKDSAGGLLCIWKPDVFALKDCCSSRRFILLSVTFHCSIDCVIGNIYAPNEEAIRRQL